MIRLVDALQLPPETRVDKRVTKELLLERGVRTTTDRRRIREDLDKLVWVAALKPDLIGIPANRGDGRGYGEIAVLEISARPDAKLAPLATLVHRAVPYPVLLVCARGEAFGLSLAHKRSALNEPGRVVLDADLRTVELSSGALVEDDEPRLVEALALARQPLDSLDALYDGWMRVVDALAVARRTGRFFIPRSPEQASRQAEAMAACDELEKRLARRRRIARREKQLARQVALNLEIKLLERRLAEASASLSSPET